MPPRILVIEDEPLMLWSLRQRLETAGYVVEEACDGSKALAAWGPEVDLVLLDWVLPDADGLELLDLMHRQRPRVPVLMMTAYGADELKLQALPRGATRVLDKPLSLEEVVRRIADALAGAAA